MRTSTRSLLASAVTLAVFLQMGAAAVDAQCVITGPTSVCPGSSITLCGPDQANAMYIWQGPGGSYFISQCISVTDPGTYSLQIQDMFSGAVTASCSVDITSGGPAPAVTGPASTCSGTPVTWCGPSGNLEYAWSGPGGFAASTACVSVSLAGQYQLRVRPLPDGCWTDSTVQALSVTSCSAAPTVNCPRTAEWWADQVEHGQSGHAQSSGLVSQVAACVDEHDSYFSWSSPTDGLRRALTPRQRTLRMNATREVAAVWANVCAGAIGVTMDHGAAVALDPSTTFSLPGASGTVGAWLADADAQLALLASRPEHLPNINAAYRRMINTAWHINRGLGIGPTCTRRELDGREPATDTGSDPSAIGANDAQSLAAELLDGPAGQLELGELSPNPFSSTTRLAFAVTTATPAEVAIGVYDVSGRLVREIASGTFAPGRYEARWDGRTADGSSARSGVYFVLGRIGGQQVQTRVALVH